mmetsp:Transcript_20567/g.34602  ORF Transcript_20567/g.34602 Transcript_20567/m.34602 type:complete len:295 (-) Transcript_20567:89-973(-)
MSNSDEKKDSVYSNTNGMPMNNGKNLHMDLAKGDVANRIVVCGTQSRAMTIAKHFDAEPKPVVITSSRGFTTVTGCFQGVRVSAVSIGMGVAMMDFFVREVRTVVDGPMAIIRFGTCGGLCPENAKDGTIVVASKGSMLVTRNYSYFASSGAAKSGGAVPYTFHEKAAANSEMSANLQRELIESCGAERVRAGLNVTADSFYSSQNRIDPNFDDENHTVVDDVVAQEPDALTMEMETYLLFHLAECSKIPIHATAASIVVANRKSSNVIDEPTLLFLEANGGVAALKTLILQPL